MRHNSSKLPLATDVQSVFHGHGYEATLESFENKVEYLLSTLKNDSSMEESFVSRIFQRIIETIRNFIRWLGGLFTKRNTEQTISNVETTIKAKPVTPVTVVKIPSRRQLDGVTEVDIKTNKGVKIKPTNTDLLLMGSNKELTITNYLANISVLTEVTESHIKYVTETTNLIVDAIQAVIKGSKVDIDHLLSTIQSTGDKFLNSSESRLKKAGFGLEVYQKEDVKLSGKNAELMKFDVRLAKANTTGVLLLDRQPEHRDISFLRPANDRVKVMAKILTMKMDAITKIVDGVQTNHPKIDVITQLMESLVKLIPLCAASTVFTNVLIDATHGIVMDLTQ